MIWFALKSRRQEKKKSAGYEKRRQGGSLSLCFFFSVALKSVFASKNLTSFRLLKSRADKTLSVCVCEVDRETDCFLLFVLVCFDSELLEIYVGLVCVFGGSCMYSLPPPTPGGEPRPMCPSLFCTCINTDWVGRFIKDSCVCVLKGGDWVEVSFSPHTQFSCAFSRLYVYVCCMNKGIVCPPLFER